MPIPSQPPNRRGFNVAIVCALSLEAENVRSVFDRCWEDEGKHYAKAEGDRNAYTTGTIGNHNVVLAHMPYMGSTSAAAVAASLRSSFPEVRLALVVGICEVIPVHTKTEEEIILGDIIISTAVIQYDFGRQYPNGFLRKRDIDDSLGRANPEFRAFINMLQVRRNRERLRRNLQELLRSERFQGESVAAKYPGESQDPIWHVPFDELPDFVGRITELQHLKSKIFQPETRRVIPIVGLGGVGKSRLAMTLAFQTKSEHPEYSIFWVNATNILTYEKDIREIGQKLKIPGIDDEKADIKALVKQRLSVPSKERWLLILDNADDETLWGPQARQSQQGSSLGDYLPTTMNGSIVITTRTRRVATFLARKDMIELHEPSPDEATDMFMKELGDSHPAEDRDTILILVQKLACLPLAIVQAASFIAQTQRPVQTYIELLDQPELDVIKLLSRDFGDPSRYPSAKNPVASTWLISFDHIRQHHQLAATFLSYMACFNEKNIPRSLLPEASSECDNIDAIAVLTAYSFVRSHIGAYKNGRTEELYDIHRLVRLAARNWLKMEGLLTAQTATCIIKISKVLPSTEYENKSIWTLCLPHAQRLCNEGEARDLPERASLLARMGYYYIGDGKYSEAVEIFTEAAKLKETELGPLDEETLTASAILGIALLYKGDLSAAERYLCLALEPLKEKRGVEDSDVLRIMDRLATTYIFQGRLGKAEALALHAHQTQRRTLGAEHIDTLSSMLNLAQLYEQQARWTEAEELHLEAVKTCKRLFGVEHSRHASLANLATTYVQQGRVKEAEELYMQALEAMKRVLGLEHPDTLTCLTLLAVVRRKQGRADDPEEPAEALETRKRVLGPDNATTLYSIYLLALYCKDQDREDEAMELATSAVAGLIKVFGREHPATREITETLESWQKGRDQPTVPPEAEPSAGALQHETRSNGGTRER
ncbi:hypothetical protein A1O3_04332 [Capronia epimyces CBS 606.96]|uniref:Uncharacterized protein n=1 Tax=Capronia epimyces CBS 606.96 TaxID=1182542 RepID=W9Y4G3_9EURO|nr:uncharacterized protein A1O3_04332 [Capronia epimyces CBS 606.96]EXJ87373.1 hypothetical protein A1O3_04332 [Capronia epimyces CBS 606.96]